jgi:hypothetical protein
MKNSSSVFRGGDPPEAKFAFMLKAIWETLTERQTVDDFRFTLALEKKVAMDKAEIREIFEEAANYWIHYERERSS